MLPPKRIHKLTTTLANQIAAGEVIERPASIIKELLENSLDAGATNIALNISKAGRLLIQIEDNGCGIHVEDLTLALQQHATSKITTVQDLTNIQTLGFRGEALSSIASIAKLELASRTADEEHGWRIDADEQPPTAQPIAMQVGTCIQVRDLFANIPARRKFLRTDSTEFSHIREMLRCLALSRHDVAFHLQHNGKNILQCAVKGNDASERARMIFGKSFLENSFELNYERNNLRLWGWFGTPEIARNQLDQQYFYLNRRIIKDKQLNHAIRMATQDYFYTGKHPVYVLFLEMDSAAVDINVHPAKHEVRFRNSRDIHDFILSAVKQLFGTGRSPISNTTIPAPTNDPENHTATNAASTPHTQPQPQNNDLQESSQPPYQPTAYSNARHQYRRPIISNQTHQKTNQLYATVHDFLLINDRYLIIKIDNTTVLADIYLCNEIIAYSKLSKELENTTIRRRPLLVPLSIDVSTEQADYLNTVAPKLARLGIQLEQITNTSVLIRQIPLLLEYADIKSLVKDIIAMLKTEKTDTEIIRTMSQHANDAGIPKINQAMITQMMNAIDDIINNTDASAIQKTARQAWKEIDSTTLKNILNHN